MADLSANNNLRLLGGQVFSERFFISTIAAYKFFRGAPVMIEQGVDNAYIIPWVSTYKVLVNDVTVGICAEAQTAVLSAQNTVAVEVYMGPTVVGFPDTTRTNADIGKSVAMSDSATLSLTLTDQPQLGKIVKVEDGYCYVLLDTPNRNPSA